MRSIGDDINEVFTAMAGRSINELLTIKVNAVFNHSMDALERAISTAGSNQEFAARIGVSPQLLSLWKRRGVPAGRVLAIEEATGGKVTRHELRPDIYGEPPGQADAGPEQATAG